MNDNIVAIFIIIVILVIVIVLIKNNQQVAWKRYQLQEEKDRIVLLNQYAELYEKGVITEEMFNKKKKELLK